MVEHRTENPGVGGSIPSLPTILSSPLAIGEIPSGPRKQFTLLQTGGAFRGLVMPTLMALATNLAFLTTASLFAVAHAQTLPTSAGVGPSRGIPSSFYGMTMDSTIYYQNIWGSPSPTPYPSFPKLMQGFQFETMRYPGGLESECWNWSNGTFILNPPTPQPQCEGFPGGGGWLDLTVLKQALGLTAALPLFNLNVISASFDNPADPNNQMALLKQAQGSGIPVELVELGNEVYWNYSSYTAPFPTPQAYATQASQWAAEIHGTFPGAQVAAVAATIPPHRQALAQAQPCSPPPPPFPSTEKEKEQVARFSTWNAGLGGLDVTNINALTMHPYPHLDTYICQSEIAKPTPDTLPSVFAIPFEAAADFESDIANLPSSLQALPIWITE